MPLPVAVIAVICVVMGSLFIHICNDMYRSINGLSYGI